VGARSRKRRRPAGAPRERQPRLRGEAANAAVRATLEPLRPGERPAPVTFAAAVAVVIGVANLVLLVAGYDIRGNHTTNSFGTILFAALMFAAAWGMFRARYWAVLGFQCLLAVTCVVAALALLVASNVAAVILCVAVLAFCGTLFWKLVRAMARIQMPRRPGA
jgi:hypothetical protein